MSDTPSKESTKTGRMFSSRVMKMSLLVIFLLAFLYIFSVVTISLLTMMALKSTKEGAEELVEAVAALMKIDVAGSIGAIMSLVTVRYTLRETTSNLKGTSDTNCK